MPSFFLKVRAEHDYGSDLIPETASLNLLWGLLSQLTAHRFSFLPNLLRDIAAASPSPSSPLSLPRHLLRPICKCRLLLANPKTNPNPTT